MFGDPFLPGQFWMQENDYSGLGVRGMDWPTLELLWANLAHPAYGMLIFCPLLVLGFLPTPRGAGGASILPGRERIFVWGLTLALSLFFAANQYAHLQFGTGFRYLLPLVPFLFLGGADRLLALGRLARWLISLPVLLHAWVLAAVRESVPRSWLTILTDGPQLPWLTVLRNTSPAGDGFFWSPWLPLGMLALTGLLSGLIWGLPPRLVRGVVAAEGVSSGYGDDPS